jgi:hypothetical protein
MRLTVGPLSPTVYWRRRAVVLGGLLCVVLLVVYACSGTPAPKSADPSTAAATAAASASPEASPTPSPLTPIVDGEQSPSPTLETSKAAATQTGPCTDAEMSVTPVPDAATARRGAPVKFTLKIRNVSTRSCARDVGADMQELYLQQGAVKVWSSDACDPRHGSDVLTFAPGREAAYYVMWDGKANTQGCANRQAPAAGTYQLVGRLGTRLSDPVNVAIAG